MSKSKSRREYEKWRNSYNKRFAGKTVPADRINYEISKLCKKLDENIYSRLDYDRSI